MENDVEDVVEEEEERRKMFLSMETASSTSMFPVALSVECYGLESASTQRE